MTDVPPKKHVIMVHPADNVATALMDLEEGSRVSVTLEQSESIMIAGQPIPRGHKIAIRVIMAGTPIIKYGEQIGVAIGTIEQGSHVHIHNVTSTRVQRKQEIL